MYMYVHVYLTCHASSQTLLSSNYSNRGVLSSVGVCALPSQARSITEAPIGDPEGVTSPGLGVRRFRTRLIACVAVHAPLPALVGGETWLQAVSGPVLASDWLPLPIDTQQERGFLGEGSGQVGDQYTSSRPPTPSCAHQVKIILPQRPKAAAGRGRPCVKHPRSGFPL